MATRRGGSRIFSQGGSGGTQYHKDAAGVSGEGTEKILNVKCSRSDSEQTSGTLEIFSRAICLGTLLKFCENSEGRVQSQSVNIYG